MKLWLDDMRSPPDHSWEWYVSYEGARIRMMFGDITFASLDHDLGRKKNGYDVVRWMAEHDTWPSEGIVVHSWNIPAGQKMVEFVNRYGPYDEPCLHIPFKTTNIEDI